MCQAKVKKLLGIIGKRKEKGKRIFSHENITQLNKSAVPTKGKEKERKPSSCGQ